MWSIAAGWFDADNDGFLDLVVTNYVGWNPKTEPSCGLPGERFYCHPSNYQGRPNQIFRNNGDGTFTDMTDASGLGAAIGKGMGLAFADFDGDGLMDIFVANDSLPNFLFRNLGGFRFREVGFEMGVALPEAGRSIAGMGADFRDADNDGWPDIVVTGMVNDSFQLFRNLGKSAGFDDFTAQAGLASSTRKLRAGRRPCSISTTTVSKISSSPMPTFPNWGGFSAARRRLPTASSEISARAGSKMFRRARAPISQPRLSTAGRPSPISMATAAWTWS